MAEHRFNPNKSHHHPGISNREVLDRYDKDAKAPNLIERAKEEIEAIVHSKKSPRHPKESSGLSHHPGKSPRHHKETHGLSDDIDEDTPIDAVKGPGVFERVKEEIEALVEAIHPPKK